MQKGELAGLIRSAMEADSRLAAMIDAEEDVMVRGALAEGRAAMWRMVKSVSQIRHNRTEVLMLAPLENSQKQQ